MSPLDYLVLVLYLAGVVALGTLGFVEQKSLKDYFLGDRSIPWLAAMATLVAAGISALTFIGMPALSFSRDLTDLQIYFGFPVAAILTAWFVVPFFYRQDIITAYEYLEHRFDLKSRLLASLVFQLQHLFILGTVIAAPAKVLSEFSGLSYPWSAVVVGASTALYTIVGGIKAVIWTDVVQLILFLGGPVIALAILVNEMEGGVGQIIRVANDHHKFRLLDTSFDLSTEVTLWAALTGLMLHNFSSMVVNQGSVQKYLTTRSIRDSRRAVLLYGFGLLAIWTFFFLIGIALFAFHTVYPERLSAGDDADRVFVRFILNELPAGVRGLLLSGVFAAAMSTISAQLNSLSSVTVVDVLQRFFPRRVQGKEIRIARWMTLLWSIGSLAAALLVVRWGGLVKAGLRAGSFFSGPLLAIFLLGMLSRRASGTGVFLGSIIGLLAVGAVAQFTSVSWAWQALVGTVTAIFLGYTLSFLFPASGQTPSGPAP